MSALDDARAAIQRIAAGARASALEDEHLEFKRGDPSNRSEKYSTTLRGLADAAVCFANSTGGTVVVGVDDKTAGPDALVGTQLNLGEIRRQIRDLTEPNLLVGCEEMTFDGHRLVVISVQSGLDDVYTNSQGQARLRVGATCVNMTPTQQAALLDERRGKDWSEELTDTPASHLNPEALLAVRRLLRNRSGELQKTAEKSDKEVLKALGLMNARGKLRRSGSVLLCPKQNNRPWVVYQHKPSSGGETDAVERLTGPLLTVRSRLLELIRSRRVTTPVNLPDGSQDQVDVFPEDAVREAITNALLHRDFRDDQPVAVEHSPSSLVVISPGRLVTGVTEQNLLVTDSRPRNKSLFTAAQKLGICEEIGSGIKRMYRELIRAGQSLPEISQTDVSTRVVFIGNPTPVEVVRFIRDLPDGLWDDVNVLVTLHLLLRQQAVTVGDLASAIQKSEDEAKQVLNTLMEEPLGLLEVTPHTAQRKVKEFRLRSEVYDSLKGATAYTRRRKAGHADTQVIEHVREYNRITNRTIRNMFGMDVLQASRVLRSLRDRDILQVISSNARGPNVIYGPGPKFPE